MPEIPSSIVATILGPDFPSAPPVTWESVFARMKIGRVFKRLHDYPPDAADLVIASSQARVASPTA